jgi:hypothetical protein
MNDPRRPSQSDQARQGFDPTDPPRQLYPPHADPAYAGQAPYGPAYGSTNFPPSESSPTEAAPTELLPQYWQHGQPPPAEPPQAETPPGRPKTPRWLWFAAGAAVLLVVGLVIALVIGNLSANKPSVVPGSTAPSRSPSGTGTTSPSETSGAAMQTVVYDVTGEGRAISITYADSGGVKQTEFNVALPWSKEVSLSADETASVTIINIGHNVTCSVTVAGVQVRQHTGAGLTVCSAAG